jgi:hypothetical protein
MQRKSFYSCTIEAVLLLDWTWMIADAKSSALEWIFYLQLINLCDCATKVNAVDSLFARFNTTSHAKQHAEDG